MPGKNTEHGIFFLRNLKGKNMSARLNGDQVILEGDGLGWQGARRTLPVPPEDAEGMAFYYRAWWDTISASGSSTPGWNPAWCFGLSFRPDFPDTTDKEYYFGPMQDDLLPYIEVYERFGADSFGAGKDSAWVGIFSRNFYAGGQAVTNITGGIIGSLPANPAVGAEFTGVWLVKKDSASSAGLRISLGYNMESLAHAELSLARTSAATIWTEANVSITNSGSPLTWRLGGGMSFPTHFHARNPCPTLGRKLVIDHLAVEYFTDTLQMG